MCAQFMVRGKRKELARQLGVPYRDADELEWNAHVLPYQQAPVVVAENGQRVFRSMQFSLVPSWSKQKRVKFATHNARLFSYDEVKAREVAIYEKPTWRDAFARRHCLVPMTDFIEPIYTGQLAGNMVRFHDENGGVLVAAAIWEEWISRQTGEIVDSFSVITDDPIAFVREIGHDRSPVFLDAGVFDDWLAAGQSPPRESVELLRSRRAKLVLSVEVERPLKGGWEKRAPRESR